MIESPTHKDNLLTDVTAIPAAKTLVEWTAQRETARATIRRLMGELPPLFAPEVRVHQIERRDGYTLETFSFHNGADDTVHGYTLIPDGLTAPAPGILYLHAHGGNYGRGKDELFRECPMGVSPVSDLMAAGYVVLAIDCYAFGARQTQGPGGPMPAGREVETSWFKRHLWEGKSLWGMIVRDDQLALNLLLARPEVDPDRIAITGMSLGGSRATWLGALDDRVKSVIPVAQMTRYADFAAVGDFTGHSVYYFVPGALASGIDMEILTSLVAPRSQLILIGDSDPLSPIEGVRKIDAYTRQIYALYGRPEQFETVVFAGTKHAYTPEMYSAMLAQLRKDLR